MTGRVTFDIADPASDDARYCLDAYFDEPYAHHWFEKRIGSPTDARPRE